MSPGDGEAPEPHGGGIQGLGWPRCGGSESWSGRHIAVLIPMTSGWVWTREIQGVISAMGTQGGFEGIAPNYVFHWVSLPFWDAVINRCVTSAPQIILTVPDYHALIARLCWIGRHSTKTCPSQLIHFTDLSAIVYWFNDYSPCFFNLCWNHSPHESAKATAYYVSLNIKILI